MDLDYTHPGSDDMRNAIFLVSGVKEEEEEEHMHNGDEPPEKRKTEIRVSYNFKGMHM